MLRIHIRNMSTSEQIVLKKESASTKTKEVSICDLMKNNTSEVLQKLEYQVPNFLQGYTDLFTKYLHSVNTLYGTCYISEKQFFDKLGFNHKTLEPMNEYGKFITSLALTQIESNSKFFDDYIQFRIAAIELFDKSVASSLEYYSKILSEFNKKK